MLWNKFLEWRKSCQKLEREVRQLEHGSAMLRSLLEQTRTKLVATQARLELVEGELAAQRARRSHGEDDQRG